MPPLKIHDIIDRYSSCFD